MTINQRLANILSKSCMILILVLMCCPISIFTNISFGSLFVFYWGSLLTSFFVLSGKVKRTFCVTLSSFLFLLWLGYLLIHSLMIGGEEYYVLSIICSVILFLSYSTIIKEINFSTFFEWLIIAVSLTESGICVFQEIGLVNSLSQYFCATGSFDNPNVVAIVIAFGFPVFISKAEKHKTNIPLFILFNIALVFTALVLWNLKCRTAIFMCVISFLIFLFDNRHVKRLVLSYRAKIRLLIFIGIGIAIAIFSLTLYQQKKPSADGRFFIWQTTVQMIKEKPFSGYGYGFFEREFNPYQVKKIIESDHSDKAFENVRWIYSAYNEPLEQMINGGLVGGFIFVFIVIYMIWIAKKQSALYMSWAMSIGVVSCTNLLISSKPIWMITILVWAHIATKDSTHYKLSISPVCKRIGLALCLLLCVPSCYNKTLAQYNLKQCQLLLHKQPEETFARFEKYRQMAGSSETYYRLCGQALLLYKRPNEAKEILSQASQWSSNNTIYWNLYKCHRELGETQEAESYLTHLKVLHAIP